MRGSRPGERRGGRQKGTPNKKTALTRAAIAARAANENLSPLDLMLASDDPNAPRARAASLIGMLEDYNFSKGLVRVTRSA
jgi:hypothetical protein